MDSFLNKTPLARDKQIKEDNKNYNNELRITKKTTKVQKLKQFELNKRRTLLGKQNEPNKETKYEKKTKEIK